MQTNRNLSELARFMRHSKVGQNNNRAKSLKAACALTLLLGGCASSDFSKLVDQVKENCHTTIDAQVSAGITGIGGAGHFQQECWPTMEGLKRE